MPHVVQVAMCVLALIELDDAISVEAGGGSQEKGHKADWNLWTAKQYFEEVHQGENKLCHTCNFGECEPDAPDRPLKYMDESAGLSDCQLHCLREPDCNYLTMFDGWSKQCVMTKECKRLDTDKGMFGRKTIWKKTAEAGGPSAEVPAPAPFTVALAKVSPQAEMQSREQQREERERKRESKRAKVPKATAFFVSSDGQRCLEGEEKYIEKKVKELEVSFLAKEFADAVFTLGSCVENGFTSGPHESPCFKKAEQYTKTGPLDEGFWAGDGYAYALRSRKHICH